MNDKTWYIAVGGEQEGPFGLDEILPRFRSGELGKDTYVFTQGMENWVSAAERPEFRDALSGGAAPTPSAAAAPAAAAAAAPASAVAPSSSGAASRQEAHEIDYEIFGEEMQYVEITLDPREACIAEAGAFLYMDPGIQMETMFGDGSAQSSGGVMDMLMSAGKRVLTGESLFMTVFGNAGSGRAKVAFASPYPGSMIPVDLREHNRQIICQKDAFLCAAKGISVGIHFQKKLWTGLFGGEGFILQKLEGDGFAFLHAGGAVMKRTLGQGEILRVDTGCLVGFEAQVDYDIQMQRSIKTGLFGGEGLFLATLTGPGTVWLQSLPFSRMARKVFAAAPQAGGKDRGEGSVLGGIGDLMMGNR